MQHNGYSRHDPLTKPLHVGAATQLLSVRFVNVLQIPELLVGVGFIVGVGVLVAVGVGVSVAVAVGVIVVALDESVTPFVVIVVPVFAVRVLPVFPIDVTMVSFVKAMVDAFMAIIFTWNVPMMSDP